MHPLRTPVPITFHGTYFPSTYRQCNPIAVTCRTLWTSHILFDTHSICHSIIVADRTIITPPCRQSIAVVEHSSRKNNKSDVDAHSVNAIIYTTQTIPCANSCNRVNDWWALGNAPGKWSWCPFWDAENYESLLWWIIDDEQNALGESVCEQMGHHNYMMELMGCGCAAPTDGQTRPEAGMITHQNSILIRFRRMCRLSGEVVTEARTNANIGT